MTPSDDRVTITHTHRLRAAPTNTPMADLTDVTVTVDRQQTQRV